MKSKHLIVGFFFLYIIGVFLVAVLQFPARVASTTGLDKIFHFIEFFILAILLFKVLDYYKCKKKILVGIPIAIACILFSELIQVYSATRTFSYLDMVADALGFALGWGVMVWNSSKR